MVVLRMMLDRGEATDRAALNAEDKDRTGLRVKSGLDNLPTRGLPSYQRMNSRVSSFLTDPSCLNFSGSLRACDLHLCSGQNFAGTGDRLRGLDRRQHCT